MRWNAPIGEPTLLKVNLLRWVYSYTVNSLGALRVGL